MPPDKHVGGVFKPNADYDCTGGIFRNGTFVNYSSTPPMLTPTAAFALTAAQSGTDIFLNAAAGFLITLPAPAAGLSYRFTVAAAFATTNFTIGTLGGANIIQGGATVAGADVPAADEDLISFVATAELKGDFVEIWSDGTTWFVNGRGTTAGSITFTVT